MLFRREFHPGLRDGRVTLSFRAWRTPRAKAGSRHRFGAGEQLEVVAVERVRAGELGEEDARRAGFPARSALVEFLARSSGTRIRAATPLFRVELRYAGRPSPVPAPARPPSAAGLRALAARVDAMERRSRAPWAWRTLELIGRRPHVRAADLARTLARERAPFKADVRRLKRLGLTRSHEVGYELTALGRAVLRTREPGKRSGKERGG